MIKTLTMPSSATKDVHLGGWRKDLPDARDFRLKSIPATPGAKLSRQAAVDNSRKCSPICDQGALGACFGGNMLVRLLNGQKKSFRELHDEDKEFWVYSSTKEGKIVPGLARCHLTGRSKKVIRVTLDNGNEITCTPDHRFMLRDGSYREAQHLAPDVSLMPLYVRYDRDGYQMCFDNSDNKYHKTHNIVAYHCHRQQLELIEEAVKCVHHIDFDKLNNEPSNLKFMGRQEHILYHASLSARSFVDWNGSEKQRLHSQRVIAKQYEEDPNWNEGAAAKGGTQAHLNRLADNIKLEKWRREWQEQGHTPEAREKAIVAMRATFAGRSEERKQEISQLSSARMRKYLADPVAEGKLKKAMVRVGKNSGKTKLVSYARQILDKHGVLSKETWDLEKRQSGIDSFPKFDSFGKYFSGLDELKEAALHYNHRVTKVEDFGETMDVYCLEVPEHHNFALAAGVFVHNCTAHMLAGIVEYNDIRWLPKADRKRVSRLFQYYATRVIEGTVEEDSGAYIRDAIKAAVQSGVAREAIWKYKPEKFTTRPPQKVWDEAVKHVVASYHRIDDGDLETMKQALAGGHLVGFGFTVYSNLMTQETAASGVLDMPGPHDQVEGGHAVCLVGYDDERRMFKVRNSWSRDWGQKGYFWMPYDFVGDASLANDFWVVNSAPAL